MIIWLTNVMADGLIFKKLYEVTRIRLKQYTHKLTTNKKCQIIAKIPNNTWKKKEIHQIRHLLTLLTSGTHSIIMLGGNVQCLFIPVIFA